MNKTTVNIVGGSGYAGGEILRLLLGHPRVTINQTTSNRFANQPVVLAHPNLRSQTQLVFTPLENLTPADVTFVCLPNTISMGMMPNLQNLSPVIIDLGADYRLRDAQVFKSWYGKDHQDSKNLENSVYGLAELYRDQIKTSNLIACGGCEATAITLGLYPLVESGVIEKHIIADVKIGSSAAGNKPGLSSHHPERHGVLRSYHPTHHRHQAEVNQALGVDIEISATAVNLVRGILATIHTKLVSGKTEKDVWKAYRSVYGSEPFIRLVKQNSGLYRYPEPKLLWGSNYCDIGFELDMQTGRLVVLSAIDNLMKGTAGQAVQAMNIRFGFEETESLGFSGLHPV